MFFFSFWDFFCTRKKAKENPTKSYENFTVNEALREQEVQIKGKTANLKLYQMLNSRPAQKASSFSF